MPQAQATALSNSQRAIIRHLENFFANNANDEVAKFVLQEAKLSEAFDAEDFNLCIAIINVLPDIALLECIIEGEWPDEQTMFGLLTAMSRDQDTESIADVLDKYLNRESMYDYEAKSMIIAHFCDALLDGSINSNNANNNGKNVRYKINSNNSKSSISNTYNKWALNADEEDTFPSICETLVSDVHPAFVEFSRKVAKVCSSITNASADKPLKLPTSKGTKPFIIRSASPDNPLDSLVTSIRDKDMELLPLNLSSFEVSYKSQEGIGPGVVRDFFSGCINQVTTELLERVEGSDFYNIKRNLNLNDSTIKRKLVTFGYVMAIMIYNNISFPFKLKRSLLHMCLFNTPPSQDVSYLVYQMMEDPESTGFVVNLLRKPQDIEFSGLDFEDIGRKPKPVTTGNFTSFLRSWVEHYHIPKGCKYVAQGFNVKAEASEVLLKAGLNVYTMFSKMCVTKYDKALIEKFVKQQVLFTSSVPADVKKWFVSIVINSDQEFFRNLLHFWSALHTPMLNTWYQVTMGERVYSKEVCPLPESHTCYTQLELPNNIPSEAKLKEVLQTAIGYVAKGVTMLGGKKTRATTKTKTKTTPKKNTKPSNKRTK
jgi:hypothetical protein